MGNFSHMQLRRRVVLAVIVTVVVDGLTAATASWPPAHSHSATVRDLHREYGNIFRHGNRNAASHLWATFLFQRASQMTQDRLDFFFSGFCAVSGSPVQPGDFTRVRMRLPFVTGGERTGFMHYRCWP